MQADADVDTGDGSNHDWEREQQQQQQQHEEEEEECRVCRGPAEEGYPLYKPCKCRGSIGLTHQDCLESWLQVQRHGSTAAAAAFHNNNNNSIMIHTRGKCELCKTPFCFAPHYDPDAPETLPRHLVAIGILKLAVQVYTPLLIRTCLCASLWLCAAPLFTAWLYHGWMTRPSVILTRWNNWNLIRMDWVSGAVVVATIIISFLSLMSFADFLRVQILHNNNINNIDNDNGELFGRNNNNNNNINNNNPRRPHQRHHQRFVEEPQLDPSEADIDNELWTQSQDLLMQQLRANNNTNLSNNNNSGHSRSSRRGRGAAGSGGADGLGESSLDQELHHPPQPETRLGMGRIPNNRNSNNNHFADEEEQDDTDNEEEEEEESSDDDETWEPNDDDDFDDDDYIRQQRYGGDLLQDDDDEHDDQDEEDENEEADEVLPLQPFEMELERRFLNNLAAVDQDDININNRNNVPQQQPQPPPRQVFQRNDARIDRINNINNNNNNMAAAADLMMDDDAMDVDINIALDELLGVRGPLGAVVRNLLWLLAFNAVYLGFFAFTPRVVGMAVNSILFNTTNIFVSPVPLVQQVLRVLEEVEDNSTTYDNATTAISAAAVISAAAAENVTSDETVATEAIAAWNLTGISFSWSTPLLILRAIEAESERLATPFKLSDLFGVAMGYFACAMVILLVKSLLHLSKKFDRFRFFGTTDPDRDNNNNIVNNNEDLGAVQDALDEINRIMIGAAGGGGNAAENNPLFGAGEDQGIAMAFALGVALDVMTAIVKVGVLLMLKMFLLPISLGICLDASTLSLFGSTVESRIAYAGRDLFSFTLLHWVAGITFMLLVTVSVLQLREVAHPDLLAQVIRPQEPQPDLLGNLMHENVSTHAKRMALSIIIYAALLTMHVYIPIRLFTGSEVLQYLPFLQCKVSYLLMPQLQMPLELLFFHLCMLGILEKNKNSIGELQHHWFKFLGRLLGLTGALLPRVVSEFRLIGSRPIYVDDGSLAIDPFWYELAKTESRRENLITANLHTFTASSESAVDDHPVLNAGETKANGERVLRFGSDCVRLPINLPGRLNRSRSLLLPTKLGRYRLKRDAFAVCPVFQLWEEVPGDPIPRPPDGWDDLGVGGADVQGRWAWSREKKSNLERGVAYRTSFYRDTDSAMVKLGVACKIAMLALLSWAVTTLVLGLLFAGPLAVGRFFYYILRVPDKWIHDPFTFAVGSFCFFPMLRSFLKNVVCSSESVDDKMSAWVSQFRSPPFRKFLILLAMVVLVFGVAPLLAGSLVDIAFIKSKEWFMGKEAWVNAKSVLLNWLVGNVVLFLWIELCLSGLITRRFFTALFEVPAPQDVNNQDANENNENNNEQEDPVDAQASLAGVWEQVIAANRGGQAWQGKDGRVARFVDVLKAVFLFEWDKVDPTILLYEFAVPITYELASMVFFPMVMVFTLSRFESGLQMLPLLFNNRRFFTRATLLCAFLWEASNIWEAQVRAGFEVAHKAARDERYLIGEVLLNYNEQQQ